MRKKGYKYERDGSRTLSPRDMLVLRAVVEDYISSAEPVGSRTIVRKHRFSMSPATVRNIMADLEEEGYLMQPHISAGRIPTGKGFRFYIDSLLQIKLMEPEEKKLIEDAYCNIDMEIGVIMKTTSRVLSRITNYPGIVFIPKFNRVILKHIEFIKLGKGRILVIFISKGGLIQNRVIEWEEDLSQDELDKITRHLNGIIENLTLDEIKEKIMKEIEKDRKDYDELYRRAIALGRKAIEAQDKNSLEDADIYIEGTPSIFDQPEFSDIKKMRDLYQALQEKKLLLELLEKSLISEGVQVIIGEEMSVSDIKDLSFVLSPYGRPDSIVGVIGVVGPIRMNYARVIPLVEYTSQVINNLLERI